MPKLPEDGNPVPKHVGVETYHELYFMICMLLYFTECICCLTYWMWHSVDRATWYILIIKANEMHYFSNLFLIKNSTCFGQIYCPSSGVSTLYTQQYLYVFVMLVSWLSASEVRSILTSLAVSITCITNTYCCVYSVETPDDGQ